MHSVERVENLAVLDHAVNVGTVFDSREGIAAEQPDGVQRLDAHSLDVLPNQEHYLQNG